MSAVTPAGDHIHLQIARAARETGADFNFMLQTASRESSFDPNARASTSSAAGLYQFLDQTWLAMVSRHGERHGLSAEAASITQSESGRYQIADPEERQRILDMRFDPAIASRMAGELASENASILESRIGRAPTTGELYAAHFLGAGGASQLINAASATPNMAADELFPAAAAANRPVFYQDGQARTVRQVLAGLTRERSVEVSPSVENTPTHPPLRFDAPVADQAEVFMTRRLGGYSQAGTLSPAIVAILASLDAPRSRDDSETS